MSKNQGAVMQYLDLKKVKECELLEEKYKKLEAEAQKAFLEENLSKEHKDKFNELNKEFLKAHKEWQECLHKNAGGILPQKQKD